MSMQQALGAVGFVVGSYFGYPQLGFVVGSLVGGALTPAQKVEGPRIDDQKVAVSSYGVGIPRLDGTGRVAGVVVWSTDKIEVSTTDSQGKGGGGVETTTYQYYVHMRILLCERPANGAEVGLRKIWRDGKLIADFSAGLSAGSSTASAVQLSLIGAEAAPGESYILYQGYEDQLPDPTMELFEGVGTVPAMRGVVSLQFNNVECPGGRVPQFSFELAVDAETIVEVKPYASTQRTGDFQQATAVITKDVIWHYNQTRTLTGRTLSVWSLGTGWDVKVSDIEVPLHSNGAFMATPVNCASGSPEALVPDFDFPETQYFYAVKLEGGVSTIYEGSMPEGLANSYGGASTIAAKDMVTGDYAVGIVGEDTGSVVRLGGASVAALPSFDPLAQVAQFGYVNGLLQVVLWLDDSLRLVTFNEDLELISSIAGPTALPPSDTAYAQFNAGFPAFLRYRVNATDYTIFKIESSWTAIATTLEPNSPSFIPSTMWATETGAIVGPNDSGFLAVPAEYSLIQYQALTPRAASVADIISDECTRAGLLPDQFDVAGIDDMVHGYTRTNPASARSNIQPLMTAYAIDATEEDGKIRFFHRSSKTSVVTIPYDELGCVEDGAEAGDPMPLTRAQEAELPRSVNLSYLDPSFDYQTATEPSQRQITTATEDRNIEMPIATSADHAATVANWILYDAYAERNRRSCKLSRKFAYLSAGDVFTPEYPRGTFQARRIAKMTDTGALLEIEVVDADADLYLQQTVGSGSYAGQTVDPLPPPTRQQLLDIPILRDSDDDAGLYDALEGFGVASWRGAALYDGASDAELELVGTVRNTAIIGFVETLLGNWAANVVDETNVLTVNIGNGELSSTTRDLMLSSTVNACAIGAPSRWEIVQFQRAEFLGSGRYALSGLRRGMRGTEHAQGNHAVGDTFVLLTLAGMLRPVMEVADIGKVRQYRAISQGRSMTSAASEAYVNTAEGLRPLSPINLRAARQQNGDLELTWDRRTRLSDNWMLGVMPLGEASEAYEVDVIVAGLARRTLSSSSRSLTYTAVQQAADGSGSATAIVYQMSAIVGRGRGAGLEVSLTPPPDASGGPWSALPGEASSGYIRPLRWLGIVGGDLQVSAVQVEPVNGWRLYNFDGTSWRQDTANVRSLPGDSAGFERTNGLVVDVGIGRYALADNILRTDSVYVGLPLPVAPSVLGVEGTLNIGYAAGYFYRVIAFQGGGLGLVRSTDSQTWTFVATLPPGLYDHLTSFGYNPFAIYETPGAPLLLTSIAKNGVLRAFWTDLASFNLFAQVQGNGGLSFDGVSSSFSIEGSTGSLFLRADTDYGSASMVMYTTTDGSTWSGPTSCTLPDETATITTGSVTTTQRYRLVAANIRFDGVLGKWISTNGLGGNGSVWWAYTSDDGGLTWSSLDRVLSPMVSSIELLGNFGGEWFVNARTQGQRYQTLKSSNLTTWVHA